MFLEGESRVAERIECRRSGIYWEWVGDLQGEYDSCILMNFSMFDVSLSKILSGDRLYGGPPSFGR